MGNQSTKNYKFAEKNKWRLQTWRLIRNKLLTCPYYPVSSDKAIGAYLPSKSDKDRDIACRRFGFNKNNLIPLERDALAIYHLRSQNKAVLAGDAWENLSIMPPSEIDFVHLDLCNGLTSSNRKGLDLFILSAPVKPGGVFSINLLAGRDSRDFFYIEESFKIPSKYQGHRGFLWLLNMLLWDRDRYQQVFDEEISDDLVAEIAEWCEPHITSYRSGNLRMDSIVFRVWQMTGHYIGKLSDKEKIEKFNITREKKQMVLKLRRPYINYKAIRNQRIKGALPPIPSK